MSHSHISNAELVELPAREDLRDKPVSTFVPEYTIITDSYAAALLTSVLERIQPEIYRCGNIGSFVFVYTENTAFFVKLELWMMALYL